MTRSVTKQLNVVKLSRSCASAFTRKWCSRDKEYAQCKCLICPPKRSVNRPIENASLVFSLGMADSEQVTVSTEQLRTLMAKTADSIGAVSPAVGPRSGGQVASTDSS